MNPTVKKQRERLKSYIETANDSKIKAFYTLLESELNSESDDFVITDNMVAEAESRMESYEKGNSKGYSWKEAKSKIAAK